MGFISLVISQNIFSEYRVYQYYVRSKVLNLAPTTATLVNSTLDPKSYVAYNGGRDAIEVSLLRSWMCLGDTSKKNICEIADNEILKEVVTKP